MKRQVLIFVLAMCALPVCCAPSRQYLEKDYQEVWCKANNGKMEVILPDKARVDCVTNVYAIEFDFAKKWGESIGQALYYSAVLNKKAGVVLILENGAKDTRYLERLKKVANLYGITVWTMTDGDVTNARATRSYVAGAPVK